MSDLDELSNQDSNYSDYYLSDEEEEEDDMDNDDYDDSQKRRKQPLRPIQRRAQQRTMSESSLSTWGDSETTLHFSSRNFHHHSNFQNKNDGPSSYIVIGGKESILSSSGITTIDGSCDSLALLGYEDADTWQDGNNKAVPPHRTFSGYTTMGSTTTGAADDDDDDDDDSTYYSNSSVGTDPDHCEDFEPSSYYETRRRNSVVGGRRSSITGLARVRRPSLGCASRAPSSVQESIQQDSGGCCATTSPKDSSTDYQEEDLGYSTDHTYPTTDLSSSSNDLGYYGNNACPTTSNRRGSLVGGTRRSSLTTRAPRRPSILGRPSLEPIQDHQSSDSIPSEHSIEQQDLLGYGCAIPDSDLRHGSCDQPQNNKPLLHPTLVVQDDLLLVAAVDVGYEDATPDNEALGYYAATTSSTMRESIASSNRWGDSEHECCEKKKLSSSCVCSTNSIRRSSSVTLPDRPRRRRSFNEAA